MDRGAARSKKRALKTQTQPQASPASTSQQEAGPSKPRPTDSQPPHKEGSIRQKKKFERPNREAQSKDPSLYVPKAIRTSAALIYSKEPFSIPPPTETLENVRRIDLSGSDVTDVSWLKGTNVTWLSLNGCKIDNGWEEVGDLKELAVLNINGCGLKFLPPSLAKLSNLKAIVAMNNDWTALDDNVVEGWKELNSMIISHSPNLTTLPPSLSKLYHLSKLTFSHCPKLTSESLPDLTNLPLLRDVKMNNLPLLTKLPIHISTWGKGDLSLAEKPNVEPTSTSRNKFGDGLEVLDLGNCSLSFDSISTLFNLNPKQAGSKKMIIWSHLRSLSLHSNPLTISNPNYIELLQNQNSGSLPNLQIIDAKRVVERKRKGEIQESKYDKKARERKEGRLIAKPSGSNMSGNNKEMRKWGGNEIKDGEEDKAGEMEVDEDIQKEDSIKKKKEKSDKKDKKEKKHKSETAEKSKKRKHNDQPPTSDYITPASEERNKKRSKQSSPPPPPPPHIAPAQSNDITDSTRIPQSAKEEEKTSTQKDKSGKQRDAVVGLIEINSKGEEVELNSKKKKKLKAKLKKGDTEVGNKGIDLREVFGKKDNSTIDERKDNEENGSGEKEDNGWGLGVGGW